MFSNIFKVLCCVALIVLSACVATERFREDGSYAGIDTRLFSEDGPIVSSTDANGVVSDGPVVALGKDTAPLLPPPFGTLAASLLAMTPWLIDKRSRRQIISKPLSLLKTGDIAGAAQAVVAGVGLGHSEPDPRTAFRGLREKGVREGWIDPVSYLMYEDIGKSANPPTAQTAEV